MYREEGFMIVKLPRCGWLKYLLMFLCMVVIMVCVTTMFYYYHISYLSPLQLSVKETEYQYGAMIDAGSSGSRVYLYKWPPSQGKTDELLHIEQMKDKLNNIMVMKTSPGLSVYEDNPLGSYESIKPLLLYAAINIPNKKHTETPLYILCTAGMRLLSEEKRNNIMNVLASKIQQEFQFFFQPSHIEVIDGRMEGVYGWIAVNYMLGRFNHNNNVDDIEERPSTVGALDMGGASTQITYEVPKSEVLPSGLTMDIDLGCHAHPGQKRHTYHLYVTTFLGLGANEARKQYVELLIKDEKVGFDHGIHQISDPCLPKGMQETQTSQMFHHVILYGSGNFTECRTKLYPLLNIPTTCPQSPCSMNGVYQPPIHFYQQEMYGFSEYWYTMDDILRIGGQYKETKFIAAAKQFCAEDWSVLSDRFKAGEFPNADQHRFQYQCFKSAWVLAVLHDGHHFPSNYDKFISAKTVNNEIVQWTYGAMIYRTRYLPLRGGVNKELSVSRSQTEGVIYYGLILCFLVVILAIAYWLNKLRKMRSLSLPKCIQDIGSSRNSYKESLIYDNNRYNTSNNSQGTMVNFENVCLPPQRAGLLPRSFSESLLSRDIGTTRVPIILGDY